MAKEKENIDPAEAEQEKRAKEEEARLEKEKKEQQKEREKRKKRREAKMKKLQKKEQKRIKWLINLPFMSLFKVSTLITFLSFIFIFFWLRTDIYESILLSFFIFTGLYLGLGVIMVAIFYMLSVDKEQELKEELRRLKEEELKEEEARQQEEMNELEALERELAEKKLKEEVTPAELPGTMESNQNEENSDAQHDLENMETMSDDEPMIPDFDDLEQKDESIMNTDDELGSQNDNKDEGATEEEFDIPELPSRESSDDSYLEDIFGEEIQEERENS